MPVPDYQSLMRPTLRAVASGDAVPVKEIRELVATSENLSLADQQERVPSGQQTLLANRVSWALLYMSRAGLVEKVRRAVYRLATEGKQLLAESPTQIDIKVLRQYPAYVQWEASKRDSGGQKGGNGDKPPNGNQTPEEAFEHAGQELRSSVEAEVLERVMAGSSDFLEQIVVDLLIAMGYGGGDSQRGQVTGGSGDGGIDGTIREDALGLDEIYVQAKKYAVGNDVGVGPLRNFAGALVAAGTSKGVFVTTASFTSGARDFVGKSPQRIVLIDGRELARLMVSHGVGVRVKTTYQIKRIDEDYFDSEDS